MPTESREADRTKRKRRWFQFSLRTLFAIIALLVVAWYGNQIRLTANRQALRREIAATHGSKVYFFPGDLPNVLTLPLYLFRDETVEIISVSRDTKLNADEELLIQVWFPEARIERTVAQ
jgi:hypothetical protein